MMTYRKGTLALLMLGLSLLAGAEVYASPVPEQQAVVERYDAQRQVLVIGGREYRLSAEVARQVSRYVAEQGAGSLVGKQIAYSASESGSGQPVIESLAY